jgi:predicted dinucleotide-binding enzyme
MKIVVIGGSGLIGSKLVSNLRQRGTKSVAASPPSGVNTITGEGLAAALAGAQVVVDVANSPSFEDKAALDFFETSAATFSPQKHLRRRASHCVIGRRRRPPGRERLLSRKDGAGAADQGFQDSLHDRPLDAILRVPRQRR